MALAAAFSTDWAARGMPADQLQIVLWLLGLEVGWNVGKPVRTHVRFVLDWTPLLVLLLVYQYTAGIADDLGIAVHVRAGIHGDEWLFGGTVPTLWLQRHLYTAGRVHWYDVVVAIVYFSHFVVSLVVAGVLWIRNRALWVSYVRRLIGLCVLGLLGYIVFPAAPPWWASAHGYLPAIPRITTVGWEELGMRVAPQLIERGQAQSNELAAIPSLHAAFAALVAVFFLRYVRARWWPLLLAYPLAMALTLVYCGEHYVVDILLGWLCVAIVVVVAGFAERTLSRRKAADPQGAAAPVQPDPARVPELAAQHVLGAAAGD